MTFEEWWKNIDSYGKYPPGFSYGELAAKEVWLASRENIDWEAVALEISRRVSAGWVIKCGNITGPELKQLICGKDG